MVIDYTLKFSILDGQATNKEYLYDEIKFVTSIDLSTNNDDIAQVKMLDHKINRDNAFSGRQLPIRNKMKMTKNEYREFLTTLGFSAKYFKDWLNKDVFKDGLNLPYRLD